MRAGAFERAQARAAREPTDAEVEAVARVLLSAVTSATDAGHFYEWQDFVEEARAAIIALDEARGK